MDNQNSTLKSILKILESNTNNIPFWHDFFKKNDNKNKLSFSIHLAILVQPYLDYILEGKKTVETRFSKNKIAPYDKIKAGDIILLKKTGGYVFGICYVENAWFYKLDPTSWSEIKENYMESIYAHDPLFWSQRENATYATLIRVSHPSKIEPINWIKQDRRGWVILEEKNILRSLNSWLINQ